MLVTHILGWLTLAAAVGLGAVTLWLTASGWRHFGPPHLLPPPVPRFALVAPATDPKPGYSDYVGAI